MRRASLAAALGGLLPLALAATAAHAQRAGRLPELTLDRPDARWDEPFSALTGVRELTDGRVIVADRIEKSIQLLDLARGTSTRIGREGGGPNEYRMPGPLFALPADSTLVFDVGAMRYLVVAPDGSVAGTFSTADPSQPDMRLLLPARGVDGRGNLYLFDRGIGMRPGGGGPRQPDDSGTVLLFDRRSRTLTPMARVAVPKAEIRSEGPASNQRVMVRMGSPFAAQDEWAVGLDGRIGIVRHAPFQVEWLAPNGQRVAGPTMTYEKLRVTDRDKEEYRNRAQSGAGMRIAMTVENRGSGTSASAAPAPTTGSVALPEPTDWPEFKPPFLGGAAVVAPDGRLWVLRTRPAGDDVPRYDVFDSYGLTSGTVTLPAGTRLLGFGRNSAYVVRKDADELEYLERYRLW